MAGEELPKGIGEPTQHEVDEATRQHEQLARYLKWKAMGDELEGPTRLSTLLQPMQQERIRWLAERCEGRILEVGCSWGYVLACCGGHVGVDWEQPTVELARVLSPDREFIHASTTQLPFENGSFDTVMLPEVLEHVAWEEVPTAISEAKRVARQKVLVTMPDGSEPTREALCFKHIWLLSAKQAYKVAAMLGRCSVEKVGMFLCFEAWK